MVRGGGRELAVAVLDGHFPVSAPRQRTVFRQVWNSEGVTPGTEVGRMRLCRPVEVSMYITESHSAQHVSMTDPSLSNQSVKFPHSPTLDKLGKPEKSVSDVGPLTARFTFQKVQILNPLSISVAMLASLSRRGGFHVSKVSGRRARVRALSWPPEASRDQGERRSDSQI